MRNVYQQVDSPGIYAYGTCIATAAAYTVGVPAPAWPPTNPTKPVACAGLCSVCLHSHLLLLLCVLCRVVNVKRVKTPPRYPCGFSQGEVLQGHGRTARPHGSRSGSFGAKPTRSTRSSQCIARRTSMRFRLQQFWN